MHTITTQNDLAWRQELRTARRLQMRLDRALAIRSFDAERLARLFDASVARLIELEPDRLVYPFLKAETTRGRGDRVRQMRQ